MINWKEIIEDKGFVRHDGLPDGIKAGMLAKLIVGDEVAWIPKAWIKGRKGQIFKVIGTYKTTKNLGVGVKLDSGFNI